MIVEVFVFARLHALPGRHGEVQQAMFEVQGPTRDESGCLSYGTFRSIRDLGEYYIHSRWKDAAAFERHAELPHTRRFLACIETLLDHPLKISLSEQLW